MYVLTKKVGTNFCIYDSRDNSIEWLDKDVVLNLIRTRGISVQGIEGNGTNFRCFNVTISKNCANWGEHGENIFEKGQASYSNKGMEFKIVCGRKIFRGRMIVNNQAGSIAYAFNNGILVE